MLSCIATFIIVFLQKKYENSSIAMNVSNSDEEKSAHPIGTGTTETSMMIPSGSTAGIIETRFVQKKQGPLSITKVKLLPPVKEFIK